MVRPHDVVQGEGVVAPAPVVADSGHAVDDEAVDAHLGEPTHQCEAHLASADDQHLGVVLLEAPRREAVVEPVLVAEAP